MTEVIAGAEAWAAYGTPDQPRRVGALVLHGFTGNPVSLRPVAEAYAAAGYAVELPRLPGHGTRWQDLAPTTWHDWTAEAAAALDRLTARTQRQVAFGLSMGGTMALHLAETGADLAGLVLVNPSLHTRDPRLKALPLLKHVVPAIPGVGNDIAKPGGDEKPYPKTPLRALASFLEWEAQVRVRLPAVTAPVLLFTSRQDHVVHPSSSQIVLDRIASDDVERVWLEHSYHVATLDHDAPLIIERALQFTGGVTHMTGR